MQRTRTNAAALELVTEDRGGSVVVEERTPPQADGCPPCPPCGSITEPWIYIAGAALAGWYFRGRTL